MTNESDPNQDAARVVGSAAGADDSLPADIEAAWEAWSKSIKGVDERGWTLLRAAFEAGVEASAKSFASELGRKGGQVGGRARAEILTPEERQSIASKAARARWANQKEDSE